MKTSTKYYVVVDNNVTYIAGTDLQTNNLSFGGSLAELEALDSLCAELNSKHYAENRQFGESRSAFAARSQ